LDGVIDVLYSPKDHVTPHGVSIDELRRLPDEFYQLQVTEEKHTPAGELKPNPKVLLDIIKAEGVSIDSCAYVGDSLFKDVAMARDVGVLDIFAKYGVSQQKPEYSLLQRVSHWLEDDVLREKEITKKGHNFEPSIVLKDNFCEIFMHCSFHRFTGEDSSSQRAEENFALATWQKSVDVQQHFNDMQMRLRNYAITIVSAMVAAIGFTFQYNIKTIFFGIEFPAGVLLIFAALLAWIAFYFLDHFGYHTLLKGAVTHAGKIEQDFSERIPGIGLGLSISNASQNVRFFGIEMNSTRRLVCFYILGGLMLTILFYGFSHANITSEKSSQASSKFEDTSQNNKSMDFRSTDLSPNYMSN
jgi:hypothetical protein